MNVEIITIGDELLIGQIVDTNSAWIGQQLNDAGFQVIWRTSVRDLEKDILEAFDNAFKRADVVLVTGGIGPTKDDITKKTLCKYFSCSMHFSNDVYDNIEELFSRSGRKMNELTRGQAFVPDVCTVIQNKVGTAPCTWFEKEGHVLVSMPGVPVEMKWLMTNEVIPKLKDFFGQDLFIKHQTFWVSGFTESNLAIELTDFENAIPESVKLAYLPQPGIIRLRLSSYTKTAIDGENNLKKLSIQLHQILGDHILVDEDKAVEVLIGDLLRQKGMTMGTAESCTGGRIANMITLIPGCSDYFKGSVVSYCNEIKHQVLGVSIDNLEKFGAVSEPVVEQMALGIQRTLNCDCAIATSGIAGPSGGTVEKPVGTVWVAVAVKEKLISRCFHFGAVREQNIQRASNMALLLLLSLLKEN